MGLQQRRRWRGSRWLAVQVGLALALPAGAHADKKGAGLFDFRGWSTPVGEERSRARGLTPGQFDLTPAAGLPGETHSVRLRFYVDRDYRSLVLRWQRRLRAQIERINAIVEPVFALRFEIESLRDWDRSHVGAPLDPIVDELAALDPAREVDMVIGLVTPMRGVATSMHQIGSARIPSRHFVLRGMDDEQEILALEQEFKLIGVDERQAIYDQRTAHKEAVVFLHEWGHALGLLHSSERTIIMNPVYDVKVVGFSAYEKRVINLAVALRRTHPSETFPELEALEPVAASAPPEEGSDKERAELLDYLRKHGRAGGPAGATGGPAGATGSSGQGLSSAEIDQFNRAVASANADHADKAWTDLAPILAHIATAKPPADPTVWRLAASLAAHIGALTGAEAVLARLDRHDPEVAKLLAEIDTQRHRMVLPSDSQEFGVPPEREVAYVAGYRAANQALGGANPEAARDSLQRFAALFPDAPGVDVIACELDIRAKSASRRAQAKKRCEAALVKDDGAVRALVLLAASAQRDTLSEKYLRRAILVDPTDPGPWRMLAQLYRATRAEQQLTELETRHQAIFSAPLPK